MLGDRNGNQIRVGSTVLLRLVVTDEISDADNINALARLENPWPGVPDLYRMGIATAYVERAEATPEQAAPAAAEPVAAAPAAS